MDIVHRERMQGMIKIIIVDDEILIREGLKILLSVYDDIEVVGDCESGNDAFGFCQHHEVDVALMDIRMENGDGVMATKMIKSLDKDVKIVILTTFKDTAYIKQAISYGANGYLLKDSSSDKIYEAIKSAYRGNVALHPEIAGQIINASKTEKEHDISEFALLDKEVDIIRLIAEGLSNKEISKELFLAEGTIKNNVSTILSKLQLRDRTQIAIFAYKNGICS